MLAIFIGAGFSKWAVDLPLARELFDFAIEAWGQREERKLGRVQSLKREWYSIHPNGEAEEFVAEAMGFPEKDREAVIWYIARRLSDPFIWKEFHAGKWRRHVLMIDEHRGAKIGGAMRAKNFISQFYGSSMSGIITTNYDMLLEYAMGTKVFNYGIRHEQLTGRGPYPVSTRLNPIVLKGRISPAKIHGSISWDQASKYTDGRRALTGRALIVPPTPEKKRPESLEYMWKLAEEILSRATRLIVFGFAFNPYDTGVLDLLRYSTGVLQSALLIDIQPPVNRAKEIWPNVDISTEFPPAYGDLGGKN